MLKLFCNYFSNSILLIFLTLLICCNIFSGNVGLQVQAFGNNFTNNISIHKTENTETKQIILDYYVLQTFQSPSRGIF